MPGFHVGAVLYTNTTASWTRQHAEEQQKEEERSLYFNFVNEGAERVGVCQFDTPEAAKEAEQRLSNLRMTVEEFKKLFWKHGGYGRPLLNALYELAEARESEKEESSGYPCPFCKRPIGSAALMSCPHCSRVLQ